MLWAGSVRRASERVRVPLTLKPLGGTGNNVLSSPVQAGHTREDSGRVHSCRVPGRCVTAVVESGGRRQPVLPARSRARGVCPRDDGLRPRWLPDRVWLRLHRRWAALPFARRASQMDPPGTRPTRGSNGRGDSAGSRRGASTFPVGAGHIPSRLLFQGGVGLIRSLFVCGRHVGTGSSLESIRVRLPSWGGTTIPPHDLGPEGSEARIKRLG